MLVIRYGGPWLVVEIEVEVEGVTSRLWGCEVHQVLCFARVVLWRAVSLNCDWR